MNRLLGMSVVILNDSKDLSEQDQRHVTGVTKMVGFSPTVWVLLTFTAIDLWGKNYLIMGIGRYPIFRQIRMK